MTSNFTVHSLRLAMGDGLRAKAQTIRSGKTMTKVSTEIWLESDRAAPRPCTTALASIAIRPEPRPRI